VNFWYGFVVNLQHTTCCRTKSTRAYYSKLVIICANIGIGLLIGSLYVRKLLLATWKHHKHQFYVDFFKEWQLLIFFSFFEYNVRKWRYKFKHSLHFVIHQLIYRFLLSETVRGLFLGSFFISKVTPKLWTNFDEFFCSRVWHGPRKKGLDSDWDPNSFVYSARFFINFLPLAPVVSPSHWPRDSIIFGGRLRYLVASIVWSFSVYVRDTYLPQEHRHCTEKNGAH